MAIAKKAGVRKIEKWADDVCHMTCELLDGEVLGFAGGQYIIINSGRLLPDGKLGKRAYSIPSSDENQRQFELVMKRIPEGAGSNFMHELKAGDSFEFSGPWGKFKLDDTITEDGILCIATDTGITAALGLLRGQKTKTCLSQSQLIWLLSSEDYFIPIDIVRAWLPKELGAVRQIFIPPVKEERRIALSRQVIESMDIKSQYAKIYLSGDGLILTELKYRFGLKGYSEDKIVTESFFHHERLKTSSTVRS